MIELNIGSYGTDHVDYFHGLGRRLATILGPDSPYCMVGYEPERGESFFVLRLTGDVHLRSIWEAAWGAHQRCLAVIRQPYCGEEGSVAMGFLPVRTVSSGGLLWDRIVSEIGEYSFQASEFTRFFNFSDVNTPYGSPPPECGDFTRTIHRITPDGHYKVTRI